VKNGGHDEKLMFFNLVMADQFSNFVLAVTML